MKKYFLFLFLYFSASNAYCYDFEVNGVTYSFLSENEVEVSDNHSANFYHVKELSIPSEVLFNGKSFSVVQIGEYAFDNDYFSYIKLPSCIKKICRGAFRNCEQLEMVMLPSSVSKISYKAFEQNNKLSTLIIENCELLFSDEAIVSCPQLLSIYIKEGNPQEISLKAFSKSILMYATLFVPMGMKEKFTLTKGWSEFRNIVEYDTSTLGLHLVTIDEKKDIIFDLSGRRINKMGRRGIYIKNGKPSYH